MTATKTEFWSMADVRRANKAAGFYWFEPDTMRFFRTRVGDRIQRYKGGALFVSSEQFVWSDGYKGARKFSVRFCGPDGDIMTVGEFQAYKTSREAWAEIKRLIVAETATA